MNYNNLFPNIIKKIPNIPDKYFCYNYDNKVNYNKNKSLSNINAYIPSGKKMIIWFVKYESNNYSILLEMNNRQIVKCHFKYLSFDPILCLGCGSLFWCTQINNELSLNKILYLKGEYYKDKYIKNHMIELKYIIDTYINNISHSSLLQLKIPVISNHCEIFTFANNLAYNVNNIVSIKNNYTHNINNFTGIFSIKVVDYKKDIYQLYCKNDKNNLMYYNNAIINNYNTSIFVKKIFKKNIITYENIEYSDSDNNSDIGNEEILNTKTIIVYCIYIKVYDKWSPYKVCNDRNKISNVTQIKNLEYKYSRLI
tara:strand:+ start:2822 stop:3754 length:933 start_codon:yes stop_codon:yes gene_type:complete